MVLRHRVLRYNGERMRFPGCFVFLAICEDMSQNGVNFTFDEWPINV